jgi:hypothetical protein
MVHAGKFGTKGGNTMKTIRRGIAIGVCGAIIGVTMSIVTASPVTAKAYARCDTKIANMEKQAAKDFSKGKLSAADYAKVQAEIAYHRKLWGC